MCYQVLLQTWLQNFSKPTLESVLSRTQAYFHLEEPWCSRNNPAFVHESVRFVGGGVLVYGGISIDGRTDLYIIRDGPLTTRRYRDEILRSIVVPYAAAIGDDFILMDDNCSPHRANLSTFGTLYEDELLAANHPHKLSKNGKELFWKSGTEYTNSGLIASLTSCLKGAQRCWPFLETIPPTEKDFL
ncbi:transposable element Tcb2 transposase [Trichonephila clavipes]|nr:transposable element Tcb2 transposase [Trichonephila clavipes]